MSGLRDLLDLDGRWPTSVFDIYIENHLLVDFTLFTALFMAVTWATLRQRFPGRPGRVIAVCIGVTLSLSLTLTMARRNISLMDVSWLPALLLILIAGLMVASLGKQSKVGVPTGGGVVVVVFALVLASTIDTQGGAINTRPLVSLLAVVLIVRMLFFLGAHELPKGSTTGAGYAATRIRAPGTRHTRAMSARTENAVRQNSWLRGQLERARGLAARKPTDTRERDNLAVAIEQASRYEAELAGGLTRIGELARQLEWADANAYAQLRKALRRGDTQSSPLVSRQMVFEWAKVEEEEKVYRLAHTAVHEARRVRHCLDKAKDCVRTDRAERGERWLSIAAKRQERLGVMLSKLSGWERRLEEIARRQEAEGAGAGE